MPDYVRARPSYPTELIALLRKDLGLGPGRTVADIGSGTGILTGLLLGTGSSYAPRRDDAKGPASLSALRRLFHDHAVHGTVRMTYDTRVYYGRLKG